MNGIKVFIAGDERTRQNMVEDLSILGKNGSRVQCENLPPVKHERAEKLMPDQGVILADPEDTRILIFNRNTSVSDPFHKTKIVHNVFALLGFCPNILNFRRGLDVGGEGFGKNEDRWFSATGCRTGSAQTIGH